jgi:hypothetical protein
MNAIDVEDAVLVVRLNCGEPLSVSVSHPDLAHLPVLFVEASELTDEYDTTSAISVDEIIVKSSKVQEEDLEEVIGIADADGWL